MPCIFDDLILNLEQQLQSMVEDRVEDILSLATVQEVLADRLQKRLTAGEPLTVLEENKMRKISNLLESNQLLAQQSLSFSRRMIRLLGGEERYNEEGLTTGKLRSSSRVDTRA